MVDPVEGGTEPAAGVLLAAIEAATGQRPYIVGKPNSLMMIYAREMLGVPAEDCVMIGDRMDTDVVGGLEAGMRTCLVLSGVSTRMTIEQFPYRPTYVLDSVADFDPAEIAAAKTSTGADPWTSRSPRCCGSSRTRSTSSGSTCARTASTASRCSTAQGMADLVGKNIAISLESSEIEVVVERTITDNDVAGVVSGALTLPRRVQAVVAVGGGVAMDVGKYAGFLTRLPVVAVPTAVSNDGFCSPGASLTVDGRRVSCPATIPFGVVIDTAVVAGSPARFTYSGIGDLLSKFSAVADWKLAYHETGEPINDFAVMISLQSVQNLVSHAEKSVDDQRFLQLMCGALVMSGVAMEVAGSSRPASGSEHLISHAYDELAPKPSLHGLQVAVATLATTWLQGNPEHAPCCGC